METDVCKSNQVQLKNEITPSLGVVKLEGARATHTTNRVEGWDGKRDVGWERFALMLCMFSFGSAVLKKMHFSIVARNINELGRSKA